MAAHRSPGFLVLGVLFAKAARRHHPVLHLNHPSAHLFEGHIQNILKRSFTTGQHNLGVVLITSKVDNFDQTTHCCLKLKHSSTQWLVDRLRPDSRKSGMFQTIGVTENSDRAAAIAKLQVPVVVNLWFACDLLRWIRVRVMVAR